MENANTNNNGTMNSSNNPVVNNEKSIKDYLSLIRSNLIAVIIIIVTSFVVAFLYAVNSQNIYKSTTSLKVAKPKGNILESSLAPEMTDFSSDRFIANEIEILKSYNLRLKVASSLIDSFKNSGEKGKYYLIVDGNNWKEKQQIHQPLSKDLIAKDLEKTVKIEQKRGLDIIDLSVESPSPLEASVIANTYANEYKNYNLDISRDQLTTVKNFLSEQKGEKQKELNAAEDQLKNFQEQGKIIALDEQATNLIQQLSDFEAQKNANQIELAANEKALSGLRTELEKQSPKMNDYLKNFADETYVKSLQEQLAKLEINKDVAASSKDNTVSSEDLKNTLNEYNKKIAQLRKKLNEKVEGVKASIFASSPEEVKQLTQQIVDAEIKTSSLKASANQLSSIVAGYNSKFNTLPKTSIEFAKYERNRESSEKLYTLLEEKYQEALINEQSQPGNVIIIDDGRIPNTSSKPNRLLIVLVGFALGTAFAFGYVLIKNYFDNTVKTPEDIQRRNISVLGWIPRIEAMDETSKDHEFIVARRPDSIPSEAFRALRTRIQFSSKNAEKVIKTILVTSSAPREGKTTVSVNLSGIFAQSNKKVVVVDCDLRKPRLHNLFNASRRPGLVDYLMGEISFEDILRKSEISNLTFITTGTIPPNPAEILESTLMRDFVEKLKSIYDLVILDSPPIIAVTDSEILTSIVDASILVVSAETTEIELMEKSSQLLKTGKANFLGAVLNNFNYKSGYGSYYKYYYYYSRSAETKKKFKKIEA